ncbi:putative Snare region anchored in the vesicle membrane C terminus [Trypanosoma vivax]|uniref:Putative SNARE protein n=1 Tax=Trypanosoma vivax (strain Y486) TaxID=1055687 RepID=G0U4T0_TRYVY|nr:putative SNARE protein [Trypanosoma vivax]KAH8611633.1 putative Snare region anchored in the vesicle membrane C terminus [Trypanosoma vivax]CCC52445.1 putative SNARE protein [Trypanosoma vivax Y486]
MPLPFDASSLVEQQLRQAKSDLLLFGQWLALIEGGNKSLYPEMYQRIENLRATLLELSEGRPTTTSSSMQSGIPHIRVVGRQAVTSLQRQTAKQLLSELDLTFTMLQKQHNKDERLKTALDERNELIDVNGRTFGGSEVSLLHHIEDERTSLQYTRKRVQEIVSESCVVMNALHGQGVRLEGADSRVATMLESIGVSNSTVLQILRRNSMDAWLVYTGIVLTLLFLYIIW